MSEFSVWVKVHEDQESVIYDNLFSHSVDRSLLALCTPSVLHRIRCASTPYAARKLLG